MSKTLLNLLLEAQIHSNPKIMQPLSFPRSEVRVEPDMVFEHHVMHKHRGRHMVSVHLLHYGITLFVTAFDDHTHPVDIHEHMNFRDPVKIWRVVPTLEVSRRWGIEIWAGGTNEDNLARIAGIDLSDPNHWESVVLHPSGSFTEGELDCIDLPECLQQS